LPSQKFSLQTGQYLSRRANFGVPEGPLTHFIVAFPGKSCPHEQV
jgi:hypothetical protein